MKHIAYWSNMKLGMHAQMKFNFPSGVKITGKKKPTEDSYCAFKDGLLKLSSCVWAASRHFGCKNEATAELFILITTQITLDRVV